MEEKINEDQIKDFYGEKKPNKTPFAIILIMIVILVTLGVIFVPKLIDKYNIKEPSTKTDDVITKSDDANNEEYEELDLEAVTLNVTKSQYIFTVDQYMQERKLDKYAKYINNNEKIVLEGSEGEENSIEMAFEEGMLSVKYEGIYKLKNIDNIKKTGGYFSVEGMVWFYIITENNKGYVLSNENDEYQLYEINIENIEDIIISEYCTYHTCSTDGAIIKTKDNKYYFYNDETITELIVDESKIETISKKSTLISDIEEKELSEKPELVEDYVLSETINNDNNIKYNNTRGTNYQVFLNNKTLYIYTPNKLYIYNEMKVNKLIVSDKTSCNEECITDSYSIYFITEDKEIYRMYFFENEFVSLVKYDLKNITSIDLVYETDEDIKLGIYAANEEETYILGYNSDKLFLVK